MAMEMKYTTDETWVSVDGDTATVGITDYAQEQLKDLVFVTLPKVGQRVTKGKEAAMVKSVKNPPPTFTLRLPEKWSK